MKLLVSTNVLILLFVCYSQATICMENESQNIKKISSKKIRKIKKARKTFEETYYKNNDLFNWNPENLHQTLANIDKELEKIRTKAPTIPYTKQHEYRTVLYENDVPPRCQAMLTKIVQQNDIHKEEKFSLFLAEKYWYCYAPPINEDFFLSSPPRYCINTDSQFIKKLSLKAQEAWCLYVVHVAMHRSADFTHDDILSDEKNKELLIGLAARSENYSDLFNTFVIEVRDIPIDLYKEIRTINKIYVERAWLKKYAV